MIFRFFISYISETVPCLVSVMFVVYRLGLQDEDLNDELNEESNELDYLVSLVIYRRQFFSRARNPPSPLKIDSISVSR